MEKEGNEVSGSLGAHLSAPHPWPRTSETHSHPFDVLPCVLLITPFPTVLLCHPHSQARSALPSASLVPPPSPANLFAVCGHEVEAAGGDGESDWHSSKFQVTPPQNGTEWAATGLRKKYPRVSEDRGSQSPETPTLLLPFGFLPATAVALPLHGSQKHP